jgi:hypothetical protein
MTHVICARKLKLRNPTLVSPPFEQVQFGADGAANATPVEGEVDWAVPQPRPRHTAKVSRNLLETTKSVRLANRPGRSFHTLSQVLHDSKSQISCISLCPFLL